MTTFTTEDREWAYWHSYDAPKYTKQIEIDFFWPLTEQIPLSLDYTGCNTRENNGLYFSNGSGLTFSDGSSMSVNADPIAWVTVNTGRLELDVEQTTVIVTKKPALYRRALYKLMGINWRMK